jgi:hypothetical protein
MATNQTNWTGEEKAHVSGYIRKDAKAKLKRAASSRHVSMSVMITALIDKAERDGWPDVDRVALVRVSARAG